MFKHPKTYHLPWSQGITNDDKLHKSVAFFKDYEIVVTEKRDGECTSLYHNGIIHARSISSTSHKWQSVIKAMWVERYRNLPQGWRIVGENLYAQHSIRYENLNQWIEVFAIFNEHNIALSWDDTVEWCKLLSLIHVPVIWRGIWNETQIHNIAGVIDCETQEGYVVRVTQEIPYNKWSTQTAKWVRKDHIQSDEHWSKTWKPNSLKIED